MSQIWRGNRLLLVAKYNSGTTDVPPGQRDEALPQALAFSARGGAGGTAHLDLALPSAAVVDVSLFDVGGRRVATLARDTFAAGHWTWSLTAMRERAASGMYFARAQVSMNGATRDLTARVVLWR
jgi:hypothetical protein